MFNQRLTWDWDSPDKISNDQSVEWIDKLQPLSNSHLWTMQHRFYTESPPEAWDNLPHFITSNPLLADIYLNCIMAWLSDHCDQLNPDAPLYLMELGAGHARFGFYLIKAFLRKKRFFPQLASLDIRFVLTDCSESQVELWSHNPLFAQWLESGLLDLAVFLPDQDQEIVLHKSQMRINAATLQNPLIVMANYLFDSLPHDFFITGTHGCEEVRVSIYRNPNAQETNSYELGLALSRHPLVKPYYANPHWNNLLELYGQQCRPNTQISIPVGGFQMLKNLLTMCKGKLMLISADKALEAPASFLSLRAHGSTREVCSAFTLIAHNGAFSADVNYHALSYLTDQLGGNVYNTTRIPSPINIQVNTFLPGHSQSPGLEHYVTEILDTNNPIVSIANRMNMLDFWEFNSIAELLPALHCLLQLIHDSHYDPYLLKRYEDMVANLPEFQDYLAMHVEDLLDKCQGNIFTLATSDNAYSVMGILYRCCGVPQKAISLMHEGLERFGPCHILYNQLSLCYSDQRDYETAIQWAHKALERLELQQKDSPNETIQSLIDAIQSRITMWQGILCDVTA